VASCRTTAERWEKRTLKTATEKYDAARFRAAIATILAQNNSKDSEAKAKVEADKAMVWLTRITHTSRKTHIEKDKDLNYHRNREEYKKLIADLKGAK
jgi:hypothetical protein